MYRAQTGHVLFGRLLAASTWLPRHLVHKCFVYEHPTGSSVSIGGR